MGLGVVERSFIPLLPRSTAIVVQAWHCLTPPNSTIFHFPAQGLRVQLLSALDELPATPTDADVIESGNCGKCRQDWVSSSPPPVPPRPTSVHSSAAGQGRSCVPPLRTRVSLHQERGLSVHLPEATKSHGLGSQRRWRGGRCGVKHWRRLYGRISHCWTHEGTSPLHPPHPTPPNPAPPDTTPPPHHSSAPRRTTPQNTTPCST